MLSQKTKYLRRNLRRNLASLLLVVLAACQELPTQAIRPLASPVAPAEQPTETVPTRQPPGPPISPTPLSLHPIALVTLAPIPKTTSYPIETAACSLGAYNPIGFLPDNHRMVARVDRGISILDLHTGLEELFLQPGEEIVAAALSPDGSYLALALANNAIQFYQMSGKQLLYTLTGHTGRINSLKFSPDGNLLVSAGGDTWVHIWDTRGNQWMAFQPPILDGSPAPQLVAAISPDGKRLATKASEDALKFWDIQSKTRLLEIKTPSGAFNGADIAFSPDGQWIAWGNGGGPVSLNRLSDGVQVWSGGVYALAFSPDGSLLAYSDQGDAGENRVALRSVSSNKTAGVLQDPGGGLVWRLIFSPDGSLLAAATDQGTTFWEIKSKKSLLTRSTICP